jgi:N-acetylglucosamine-6-phosphate deacetylase
MIARGRDTASGRPLEVEFSDTIEAVRELPLGTTLDCYLAPGFIDLQVNGFAAVDYADPSISQLDIQRSFQAIYATGVTRFYPTVITGAPETMEAALRNLARSSVDGFHVEGPHISPEEGPRGAHPKRWVRPPDFDEFLCWQDATEGRIRIVTIAPEWPEALPYIEKVAAQGVVIAIGHTQATAAQLEDAVAAGATLSTHLGNGAHGVMRRHPNYIWHQMADDRLMADFIVDGIHLDASFLKVALRAKGIERSVLVTDAAPPAGAAPGRYRLGEQEVDLSPEGRVTLAGSDRLAGSALHMNDAVANAIRMAGISLDEAVRMATTNAARAGKVEGRSQGLKSGDRADLVQFTFDGNVKILAAWLDGRQVV